jgi:hypothetical protein
MAGSIPLMMPTNPRINEDAMRVVESMVRVDVALAGVFDESAPQRKRSD